MFLLNMTVLFCYETPSVYMITILRPADGIVFNILPNLQVILFIANNMLMERSLPDVLSQFPIDQAF